MTDEHPTKLSENEMMNDRLKQIFADFAKLPPERKKAIAEKLAKKVGESIQEAVMVAGASIMSTLEDLQEELKKEPQEPSK